MEAIGKPTGSIKKTIMSEISKIKSGVIEKVGVFIVVSLLAGLAGSFVSWTSGASDGRNARQQNESFHPKIQMQVDSIGRCFERLKNTQDFDRQKFDLTLQALKEMIERMDKRIELLYINEFEAP